MTGASKPSRTREPKGSFSEELLNQLLSQVQGKDAQRLLGDSGVVGQLKKQFAERMLSAELNHHLESEAAVTLEGAAGLRNHRNCTTPKTVPTSEGDLPTGYSMRPALDL